MSIQTASGMTCSGREPFWSAEISNTKVKLDVFVVGDTSHLKYEIDKVEDVFSFYGVLFGCCDRFEPE